MEEYNLKLPEQQVNQILAALALRPYGEVAELIAEIHKQANEQIELKKK